MYGIIDYAFDNYYVEIIDGEENMWVFFLAVVILDQIQILLNLSSIPVTYE